MNPPPMPTHRKIKPNYDQNDGKPGVVYILDNRGLHPDYYKLGQSTHSGAKRARDENNKATTGTPGEFICIFEERTRDCGKAEKLVFEKLDRFRRGKWGQEFFALNKEELECAKHTIRDTCKEVDEKHKAEVVTKEAAKILEQQRIAQQAQAQAEQRAKVAADRKREEAEKASADAINKQLAERVTSTTSQSARLPSPVQAAQRVQQKSDYSWIEIVVGLLVVVFTFRQCDYHTPTSPPIHTPISEVISIKETSTAVTEAPAPDSLAKSTSILPETSPDVYATKYMSDVRASSGSSKLHNHKSYTRIYAHAPLDKLEPPTITLPSNSHANYDGHHWGWECNGGYTRTGDTCETNTPPSNAIEPENKLNPVAVQESDIKEVPVIQQRNHIDCPIGARQVGDECVDYRRPFWKGHED